MELVGRLCITDDVLQLPVSQLHFLASRRVGDLDELGASGLTSEISTASFDVVDTEKSEDERASCTKLRAPVSV